MEEEGKMNPNSDRLTELTAHMHRSTMIIKPFLQA